MTVNSWTSSYMQGFLQPVSLVSLSAFFFLLSFPFLIVKFRILYMLYPYTHLDFIIIILFLPVLNVHWMFQLYVSWKKKNSIHLQLFLVYKHFHFLSLYLEQHFKGLWPSFPSSFPLHNLFPRKTCFLSVSPACQVLFHFRAFTCCCLSPPFSVS